MEISHKSNTLFLLGFRNREMTLVENQNHSIFVLLFSAFDYFSVFLSRPA